MFPCVYWLLFFTCFFFLIKKQEDSLFFLDCVWLVFERFLHDLMCYVIIFDEDVHGSHSVESYCMQCLLIELGVSSGFFPKKI